MQFSSRSIELILKKSLNYRGRRKSLLYFFLGLLISSSSTLLSLFDSQIMNCLARHKNLSLIWKVSSKCHNINYRAKNHVVLFCFGLQSIARFINTNASYFNTHRLESEGKFSWNFYISVRKKIKMLFTGLGRSVLAETVPSVWVPPEAVLRTSGTVSPNTDRPRPVNNIYFLYKQKWNTRWAFPQKHDIFICENTMLSLHVKRSPLLWLTREIFLNTRTEISYLRAAI